MALFVLCIINTLEITTAQFKWGILDIGNED